MKAHVEDEGCWKDLGTGDVFPLYITTRARNPRATRQAQKRSIFETFERPKRHIRSVGVAAASRCLLLAASNMRQTRGHGDSAIAQPL